MRKNIVAGNWKMNTTLQEGVALAKEIDAALAGVSTKCDVIIATPFTHLVDGCSICYSRSLRTSCILSRNSRNLKRKSSFGFG